MDSPEMFDTPFFSLDNSMPAQAAYEQGPAQNQLQVPRRAFVPFAQQAYSHSYAHPQNRQQGSYPSSPPWQLHSRQHQHSLPQYGNHYTFGGVRQHPYAMSHAVHAKTTTETKARLDKKHVEVLEAEFQKNQKPSSIVKRELAEQMGHEVARINNWFQNRRAKEKSNKRTAEYAARESNQLRDSSEGLSSGPRSPEQQDDEPREAHPAVDNMQRPIMSSAMMGAPESEDDDDEVKQKQPEVADSTEISSDDADDDGVAQFDSHSDNNRPRVVISHDMTDSDEAQVPFQTPESDNNQGFDYRSLQDFHGLPQTSSDNLDYVDESEIPTAWFHPLPEAPSDYFGESDATPLALLNAGAPMSMAAPFPSEDALKVQQLASPVSMSSTSQTPPPPKDMASRFAFKSPRPINIAARRNHQRPTPLGLAISRKSPYCQGPKTGIDMPRRRPDDLTPMRRTASATGLRLARVSEGLRSPGINFLGMRSPSYNRSASPVSGQGDSPNTHNSDDHLPHGLPYGNFNAPLTSRGFETSIHTPPVTPGLPLGYSSFANPFEQAWAHHTTTNDQPLATPSLCSHGGSELDFPGSTSSHNNSMPNYIVAGNSQPATPSFARPDASFGPGFRFGGAQQHHGLPVAQEYTFPDSSYIESPVHHNDHHAMLSSKTFQFAQNVTPQDFSGDH